MLTFTKTMILVFLIIVIIDVSQAVIINFDTKAVPLELEEIIVRKRRLSCEDHEVVNLEGNHLTKIPKGFVKSDTIRSISLKDNEIDEIPDDVFEDIPNLQCLDLANNSIPTSELLHFKHDRLKTLIFDYQTLMELYDVTPMYDIIPTQVQFPNLETLSLKGIDHKQLSLYSKLFPNLSTIYWDDNHLDYVDPDLTNYFSPQLKIIHFERNKFQNLSIKNFKNVEELYLDENPLEILRIENDSNLKILSLANCNLGTDWHFWISNLITLDLTGNRITEVIMSKKLDAYDALNLENLYLSRNLFKNIPPLENLPRLRKLSLSYNVIETIDQVIVADSLKSLNLRGNRINNIHQSAFSAVPMLEELDLSENHLDHLPLYWSQHLNNLRYLNLRMNRFKSILNTNIYLLKNVNDVYVGKNDFKTINDEEMKYLSNNCTVYVI